MAQQPQTKISMHLVCGFAWQCSERLILAVARAVGSCPDAARSVYTAGVKGVTIEYSFVGDFHMTRSTSTLRLLLLVLAVRNANMLKMALFMIP